jgi:7-alpha-hydroxysteroid dehydrogenase
VSPRHFHEKVASNATLNFHCLRLTVNPIRVMELRLDCGPAALQKGRDHKGEDTMSVNSLFLLKDQVAVVTGGGAGIGRGIAEVFAAAGAAVAVSDLKQETAETVAGGIVKAGGKAIAIACDVTDDVALENLVTETLKAFGKITILVNNAGGGGPKPFDMPMKDFIWAYQLNVFSAFRLCQLCAGPIEKAGGGSILNISSMAGENMNARMTSYSSSKAAMNHLTRNMAFDLGSKNIRVNAIAPGAIKTDALASVLTPEIERAMLKHTPLGRLGQAADIAHAALFFCSPASAWVSGQVLTVSGGGVQELD